ncbi:MAG: glycolate oxidase subunit GlcF [Gammaproteobacteria bacterium]|jgi:glycolate oxidase iron-sulfur subunit|nr:glycolate oxidase subunit GlcF [Gammaproteobacteria bacterium]
MQTSLPQALLATESGTRANEILRNCVHCGFCNATCPTYQLTGDELDGPRGRIYLIKQVLEGNKPTDKTQLHLDRCLTCRACETTCPSGVDYHLLLDTGRELLEQSVPRPLPARLVRRALRLVLPWPARFTPLLRTAQLLRPLLPAAMKQKIPVRSKDKRPRPQQQHARRILLLTGCVQDAMSPQINAATIRVLHALGIQTLTRSSSGCCGAVSHHLGATDEALGFMRRNIDAWWPDIEQGAQAVVVTASGCAPMVKDYGQLLANDTAYADKASRVSELAKDISEIIAAEDFRTVIRQAAGNQKIAFHSPCTLQHAQRITGSVEQILGQAGYTLTPVTDSHLCCGSAGTYSILQPQLSGRLRDNKLAALQAGQPDMIATANIGCLAHMASHAEVPVKHWIEYLDALIP